MSYNPTIHKLGRKAIKTDSRTLRLGKYLTGALPPPPANLNLSKATTYGMLHNDTLGDCTIAGILHQLQCQSANANPANKFVPTDDQALSYYESIDGYNPQDPTTDQGGILLDVLNNIKANGIAGQKILGYALVDHTNLAEVQSAINLFGGVYCGFNVPRSIQGQKIWHWVLFDGGIEGGHCVPVVDFDSASSTFSCISWGEVIQLTYHFWEKYFDESYVIITPDWLNAQGATPTGLDLAQLQADLAQIT